MLQTSRSFSQSMEISYSPMVQKLFKDYPPGTPLWWPTPLPRANTWRHVSHRIPNQLRHFRVRYTLLHEFDDYLCERVISIIRYRNIRDGHHSKKECTYIRHLPRPHRHTKWDIQGTFIWSKMFNISISFSQSMEISYSLTIGEQGCTLGRPQRVPHWQRSSHQTGRYVS
jgi:hypothetical protein